jgi:hypothetical protein
MMRIAYADPPYPGCAHRYAERTEVDHAALLAHLGTFDAWALSTNSTSLQQVLALAPADVRIMAWVKPFAVFKANVNPAYAWEPVIVRTSRALGRGMPTVRDWVAANITLRTGLVGAKPEGFWYWLFAVLGLEEADEFVDLFPGTGGGMRALARWHRRPRQLLLVEGVG